MNPQPAYTCGTEQVDIVDRDGNVQYCACLALTNAEGEVFAYGWRSGGFVDALTMQRNGWTTCPTKPAPCPVCGARVRVEGYGPFFTPEPTSRFAATCPERHWRGRVCATQAEAAEARL